MAITTYRDLIVYQKSYAHSLDIRKLTCKFPLSERFLLVDQMNRASRSIAANIVEGWAKRRFENIFKRHLVDSIGSNVEMEVHLSYAKDLSYITNEEFEKHHHETLEIGRMLYSLHAKWESSKS